MEEVKKELRKYLVNTEEIAENIIKGSYKHNGKVLSVYIFDLRKDEVSEEYVNKMNDQFVSDVYYSLEGDIQWNLYHVFVRENITREDIIRVEQGRTYARKYIRSPSEIEMIFKKGIYEKKIKQGLYDIWMSKLEESRLEFIADESVTFVDGMSRIIHGVPKGKQRKNKTIDVNDVVAIERINKILTWDRSRLASDLPSFGKINLITGPNAVGKTSILEFIEMAICGSSIRNPTQLSGSAIKVSYNENEVDEVESFNKQKYKARDAKWYGGGGVKNTLSLNFSRYNFYDSDASYRIAKDTSSDDGLQSNLIDILSQVALGREMNVLENRVFNYDEKIKTEHRKETQSLNELNDLIKKYASSLKSMTEAVFNEEEVIVEIMNDLTNLGWKKKVNSTVKKKRIEKINDELIVLLDTVDQAIEIGEDYNIFDLKTLESSVSLYSKANLTLIKNKKKYDDVKQGLKAHEGRVNVINSELGIIEEFSKFLEVEDHTVYENLVARQIEIKHIVKVITNVKKIASEGFEINDKEILSLKVNDSFEKLNIKKEKVQKKILDLDRRVAKLSESKNVLQTTLNKLRQLGIEYIETSGNEHDCPMCSANYSKDELRKRILNTSVSKITIEEITNLTKEKKELNSVFSKINEDLNKVKVISELCIKIDEDFDPKENLLIDSIVAIETEIGRENSLNLELKKLKKKLDEYSDAGINENGFINFINYCDEFEIELNSKSINAIRKRRAFCEAELKKVSIKIVALKKEESDLENESLKILNEVGVKGNIQDLSLFNNARFKIERLEKDIIPLFETFLEIGNEKFRNLRNKIKTYSSKCENFIKQKNEFEVIKKSKVEYEVGIKQAKENLELVTKKKTNLEYALRVILDIRTNHSKERELEVFLNENVEKIRETFLRIHSPREFSDLSYDIDQKMLILKRIGDQADTPITHTSSGQRAALALSIFLTLNSNLTDGPKVVLLDDPVIFADDLNVLSFFDYLRTLTLDGSRQIFFVTANEKVASLFRRKFRPFGIEFVDIKLSHLFEEKTLSA